MTRSIRDIQTTSRPAEWACLKLSPNRSTTKTNRPCGGSADGECKKHSLNTPQQSHNTVGPVRSGAHDTRFGPSIFGTWLTFPPPLRRRPKGLPRLRRVSAAGNELVPAAAASLFSQLWCGVCAGPVRGLCGALRERHVGLQRRMTFERNTVLSSAGRTSRRTPLRKPSHFTMSCLFYTFI